MKVEFFDPTEPNGYLANFAVSPFTFQGVKWPTVEHFYQARKFQYHPLIADLILTAPSAAEAKRLSREFAKFADPSWCDIRDNVMYAGIKEKFCQHAELAKRLLATRQKKIVELTDSDPYWGEDKFGKGRNTMGNLLMRLRDELAQSVCEESA